MILDVIRHASTEWNAQRRMQGRRDIPLSLEGRAELARWRVPADVKQASWFSSPLVRAVETARALTNWTGSGRTCAR
ncbi:MAG TPA: histidine phosphatase family protein [Casimicrobiaceae bacterium]|nr:histidine phosphatase family protein [Casimicrobiaceae bacterium]